MKQITLSLLAIIGCILSFATQIYGQDVKIQLRKDSPSIEIFKTIRLDAILTNTTNSPLYIFRGTEEAYGGVTKKWDVKKNGEEKKMGRFGCGVISKFSEKQFFTLLPGASKSIGFQRVHIDGAGKYQVAFSFNQNAATINSKMAASSKAKALAQNITKLDLTVLFEFEIDKPVEKPFERVDISYSELAKKPAIANLEQAKADPTNVFKVTWDFSQPITDQTKALEVLPILKNLKNLSLKIGENDVTLPEGIEDIALMELSVSSAGGKIHFPEKFLMQPSLLKLSFNDLSDLPDFIQKQVNIEELSLNKNNLTVIPDWVGNFNKLKKLRITNNEITKFPASFQNLTTLKELTASQNKLQKVDHIFNNSQLTELVLYSNEISYIASDIRKLTECEKLRLTDNKLDKLPDAIIQMKELEYISVERNQLSSLPEGMESLQKLYYLSLTSNQLTELPKGFSKTESLRNFYAARNPLVANKELKILAKKFNKEKRKTMSIDKGIL